MHACAGAPVVSTRAQARAGALTMSEDGAIALRALLPQNDAQQAWGADVGLMAAHLAVGICGSASAGPVMVCVAHFDAVAACGVRGIDGTLYLGADESVVCSVVSIRAILNCGVCQPIACMRTMRLGRLPPTALELPQCLQGPYSTRDGCDCWSAGNCTRDDHACAACVAHACGHQSHILPTVLQAAGGSHWRT
jgi:hypothetical protein